MLAPAASCGRLPCALSLARGTKVPTTSKDTSDPFSPSHPSPLYCQQSCPPFPGLPILEIPGEGRCGASALALSTIIQGNGLVMNKGSYFRGDLAATLTGFEEVGEGIRK